MPPGATEGLHFTGGSSPASGGRAGAPMRLRWSVNPTACAAALCTSTYRIKVIGLLGEPFSLPSWAAASHEATLCCAPPKRTRQGAYDAGKPGRGLEGNWRRRTRRGKDDCLLPKYLLLSGKGKPAAGSADGGIPRSAVPGAVLSCKQRRKWWSRTPAPNPSQLARLVRAAHSRGIFWNTKKSAIVFALYRTGQGGRGPDVEVGT